MFEVKLEIPLRRAAAPQVAQENGLRVASLLDLAGMKVAVVQQRSEAKDYIDLHALLEAGIELPAVLAAAARSGRIEALVEEDL